MNATVRRSATRQTKFVGDLLRDRVPRRYRRKMTLTRVQVRRPTAGLRSLPDFVVIGAQRAGTSSMFRYLSAHPEVKRPLRKEVDYFSAHYGRPLTWYKAHFPLGNAARSFDCTPQYFVHPLAPQRCHAVQPDVKLVVLARDPVARLISHHAHMQRLGHENLQLSEALSQEHSRIASDLLALERDPVHNPRTFFRYSYRTRSNYGAQLERWLAYYPRTSIHVLDFDGFVRDPLAEWTPLLDFLELEPWVPSDFRNWSTPTSKARVDDRTLAALRDSLSSDMDRFARLADRPLSWM